MSHDDVDNNYTKVTDPNVVKDNNVTVIFKDDETNIVKLAPAGTDTEYAAEIKTRVIEAYQPLLKLLTEANNKGFRVNVGCGQGPLGEYVIMQLDISKVFK